MISWLRSRLSAVTWLASLGAGCAEKRVVGEGPRGPGRRRGPVRSGGLLLGCWLPGPQAPAVPWLSLSRGRPHTPHGPPDSQAPLSRHPDKGRAGLRAGGTWSFQALWSPSSFLAEGEGGLSDLQRPSDQHPACRSVKEPETGAPASSPWRAAGSPCSLGPCL